MPKEESLVRWCTDRIDRYTADRVKNDNWHREMRKRFFDTVAKKEEGQHGTR